MGGGLELRRGGKVMGGKVLERSLPTFRFGGGRDASITLMGLWSALSSVYWDEGEGVARVSGNPLKLPCKLAVGGGVYGGVLGDGTFASSAFWG